MIPLFFIPILSKALSSTDITIDPPLWFSGLKNTELLLVISGSGIGFYKPSIKSISIINYTKLDSDNYLFIYLSMKSVKAGSYEITLEKDNEKITTQYEIRNMRESRSRTFDSSDVFYLIMPDRFSNGNESLDSIPMKYEYILNRDNPDARHGGDLLGIQNHLDYLEELGITALWLTPVLENDVIGNSYHGYAATNMYKVDPRFGTNEDYIRLIEECHKRGIKMIYDIVFNHISSEHPWMLDPPTKDFFNNYDKYTTTHHDLSAVYSPYASEYDKNRLTTGWFVPSMPDINQRNPYVAKYLIQNSIFWIEFADIDGYRQDTYPYIFPEFMAQWTKEVTEQYPDFNIVGETFRTNPAALAFWQENSKLNPNNTYLKSVMDFRLMEIIHDVFSNPDRMATVHEHMGYDYLYPNVSNLLRFAENHDTDRFFREEPTDLIAYKQAMTLLLTIPGIPQLYYGTEVINFGTKYITDGYVRKDFPGGWKNDTLNYFIPEGRDELRKESFNFLKTLLNFRKGNKVISEGSMKHFYPIDGIYMYQRKFENQSVLVFLNGHDSDHEVQLEQYQEVLEEGTEYQNIVTGEELNLNRSFTMKARDVLILELQKSLIPVTTTPVPSPDDNNNNKVIIIAVVCTAGVVVIAAIILAVIMIRRSKNSEINTPLSAELNTQN